MSEDKIDFTSLLDRDDLWFVEKDGDQYIHIDEVNKCEKYSNEVLISRIRSTEVLMHNLAEVLNNYIIWATLPDNMKRGLKRDADEVYQFYRNYTNNK